MRRNWTKPRSGGPEPRSRAPAIVAASTAWVVLACSGTDVGYPRYIFVDDEDRNASGGGDGGSAGSGAQTDSGGTGNFTTGGSGAAPPRGGAAGMAPSGGNGGISGSASGGEGAMSGAMGTGGVSGSGGTATLSVTWPAPYDPSGAPAPPDGHHNPGSSCMSSPCHGGTLPFGFGGTVYQADGVTAALSVEVGIADGAATVTAYSAANGNLWLPSSAAAIDWTSAAIALRKGDREIVKPANAPRGANCNSGGCHNSSNRLIEP